MQAVFAQGIEEIGSEATPGNCAGLDIIGKTAFVTEMYYGLRILDITVKENPVTLSTLALEGLCNHVILDGTTDIAYVAAGFSGIHAVDVSDLANPVLLSTTNTDGHSDGLALDLEMNLLFNADRESSLDIYDISSPAAPTLIFTHYNNGPCRDVFAEDGFLYVVWDHAGLQVWNYSGDPSLPALVAARDLPDLSYDIYVMHGLAYVAGWYSGVRIIDVIDPDLPVLSTINVPGNVRGIRPHPSGTALTFVSETAGLFVYDVTDPSAPFEVGYHDTPGSAKDMTAGWDYAYITDLQYFRIYSLGDTVDDPPEDRVEGTVSDFVQDIPIEGARVYFSEVETFTDVFGYYSILGVVPGDWYWAEVSKPGYITNMFNNLIVTPGVSVHDFPLFPITVEGFVTDAVTNEPLEGAFVSIGGYSDLTDANGAYEIFAIPVGTYSASVSLDGYQPFVGAGYIITQGINEYDFTLQPDDLEAEIIIHTEPVNPPVIIPPDGRRIRYVLGLTTGEIEPDQFEIRTSFILPNGNESIQFQEDVILQPNMLEWRGLSIRVPAAAPPGLYYHTAKVIQHPDIVISSDHFQFFKQGGGLSTEPLEWEESGLAEWLGAISSDITNDPVNPSEIRMSVSPNPFNGIATIQLQVPTDQQVSIHLFNVQGQEVVQIVDAEHVNGIGRFVLDASQLTSGVYFVHISFSNGQTMTRKVLLLQ